ncbi:hypothetical protein KSF_107010 [Reticulibacter mediterranei]|uniref:Uncharacterized protein n=1 Tax=Reticulibacter mediterranei TaxID=2778369 RepID=A0A8J3IU56_9CHLR|nr:hypothetical protein [Reticulibacter mediterranei]GHP00654.1 hypothetical protein KSF_107010 [Reticulibacter mediterranei]
MSKMDYYRAALDTFWSAVEQEKVALSTASAFVRLSEGGYWDITDVATFNLNPAVYDAGKLVPHGICLPLVLPLSEEVLVASLEEHRPLIEAKEKDEAFWNEFYWWEEASWMADTGE